MSDMESSRILDDAIARLGIESQQNLTKAEEQYSAVINQIKNVLAEINLDSTIPTLEAKKVATFQMFYLWGRFRALINLFWQRDDFGSRLCVKFASSSADASLGPYGERSGHLIVFHAAISVLEILCRHSTEARNWFRIKLPHRLSDAMSPFFYSALLTELGDARKNEAGQTAFRYLTECVESRVAFLFPERSAIHWKHCRPLFTADRLKKALDEIDRLPWFNPKLRRSKTISARPKPKATNLELVKRILAMHHLPIDGSVVQTPLSNRDIADKSEGAVSHSTARRCIASIFNDADDYKRQCKNGTIEVTVRAFNDGLRSLGTIDPQQIAAAFNADGQPTRTGRRARPISDDD